LLVAVESSKKEEKEKEGTLEKLKINHGKN